MNMYLSIYFMCLFNSVSSVLWASLVVQMVHNLPAMRRPGRYGFCPWVQKIPRRRKWPPTAVFLPGAFRGQRSMVGYSPWGCKESDTTEQLTHCSVLQFSVYQCFPSVVSCYVIQLFQCYCKWNCFFNVIFIFFTTIQKCA